MNTKDILSLKEEGKQLWILNNYTYAIKKYTRVISHNHYDGESLLSLGILHLLLANKERAYKYFHAILSINPNDEGVKEFYKIGPKILTKDIILLRLKNFIIFTKRENEAILLEIAQLLEDNLQKILNKTNRHSKLICVEIDSRHHPFAFTHYLSRPLCPKIEISLENCYRATLIHELSHGVFPSENIFLNEGLALYLQNK